MHPFMKFVKYCIIIFCILLLIKILTSVGDEVFDFFKNTKLIK